ncbi:MAG TPA: hypothetical protein VNA23_10790 [Anaerolineales bacterium]|nr:hypothetical protein [Anaerolineales bacterium]
MKTITTVLLIAFVLASCAPPVKVVPTKTIIPVADNFFFVFLDYSCGPVPVNILDTKSATLVHTPLEGTDSVTISMRLTEDELVTIYEKAISIGFFDYPSTFVIPDDQVLGYMAPALSYQLSMTNGEMTNSVSWTDDTMTKPNYTKADELRELIQLVEEIIRSHPEHKKLPEPNAACA